MTNDQCSVEDQNSEVPKRFTDGAPSLSVVIPIYNEEENIARLAAHLLPALDALACPFEIILINDGSRDRSMVELRKLADGDVRFKVIDLKRNSGQTAALMCGIDHATGDIIVPMDGDMQNDATDIGRLLDKLNEGYDVVSGWRKDRKDAAIRRNLVSTIANRLISWISGVHLHDYGCSLKAYRRDVLDGVRLYGEMHRFVPIYASWMGARITEIPVTHHPRLFGSSKYGLERIVKVVLDLIVIKFLDRHLVKPIYVFGGFGLISILISLVSGCWALALKLFENMSLIQTPLPLLATMTFITGVMCILLGLVSEILVRTYFESQSKRPYRVRETLNLK